MNRLFSGVLVPVLTTFDAALAPDAPRYVDLCQRLLALGADGLAVFGTTSEANSMSAGERKQLLDTLVDHGIPGDRLMPGIGSCSITETSELLLHAADAGAVGALFLPPFYYKGAAASDEGLFDFVAEVMRRTEGAAIKVYLYHIPPIATVGWSKKLVGDLLAAFPDRIVGLKDSSGDWENTKQLIESFPGFSVFPGSEAFLLKGLRTGGCGCITATGNVNLTGIRAVYAARDNDDADRLQQQATKVRMVFQNAGLPIPVMKGYLALKTGDDNWARVRPPLREVDRQTAVKVDAALNAIGFEFDLF